MLTKTSLSARASEFDALISNSIFTDKGREEIPLEVGTTNALSLLRDTRESGANVYIVGNGGSCAVASHISVDFCNVGNLRAMNLHEPATLTCFTNDYGYENAFAFQLEKIARKGDVLIAISSSGQSRNIINAALAMRKRLGSVITLSGFNNNNPLRLLGDINYWVNSQEYGLVEIAHLFTLHHWSDRIAVEWSDMQAPLNVANQ